MEGEGLVDRGEEGGVGEREGGVEGREDGFVEVLDDEGLEDQKEGLLHRSSLLRRLLCDPRRSNRSSCSKELDRRPLDPRAQHLARQLRKQLERQVLDTIIEILHPQHKTLHIPRIVQRQERSSFSERGLRVGFEAFDDDEMPLQRSTGSSSTTGVLARFEKLLLEVRNSFLRARELGRAVPLFECKGGRGRGFWRSEGV